MKKTIWLFLVGGALPLMLNAAALPGVPRDSNFNNTGGYDSTRVEAQMLVNVDADTEVVHFIRDNNDPRVVTKTYVLKHVDPYEFRDYIRQMVQSKRVGNATLQQNYPGNTSDTPPVATVSSPALTSAAAQPGYDPAVQLGSNTAVECLKYADGTGLLIVSAEAYRFEDSPNGIGIDRLVSELDDPDLGALNYGYQMFLYLPKYVPARNLLPLIQNMGMNVSDVTELWQGQDLVAYDPDINCLAFDVANYSCGNIARMLALYDVPIPQVRLKIQLYELTQENDDRIGIDFQSWKNNEGVDFFSVGGRYRNNWEAAYSGSVMPRKRLGSERTSFYNFNPKWNSRYLDFLASRGEAKVVSSGELVLRNRTTAQLSQLSYLFYVDDSGTPPDTSELPGIGGAAGKLLSQIVAKLFQPDPDYPVAKGPTQVSTLSQASFGFTMKVENVSINRDETRFDVILNNTSLLGFQSNGKPRISSGNEVRQTVSLPYGKEGFVIGGLTKENTVKSTTGIPFLKDIPYLKYLFSTESTSVKTSRLIVVASCEYESVSENDLPPGLTAPDTI